MLQWTERPPEVSEIILNRHKLIVWSCDDLRIKGLDVHRSDTCSWLAASLLSIVESLPISGEENSQS